MLKYSSTDRVLRIQKRLEYLYSDQASSCLERLEQLIGRYGVGIKTNTDNQPSWDQHDAFLITYGDMVSAGAETPLSTFKRFLDERVLGALNTVHILPFYPYSSSDDGFSVIDYRAVNSDYGTWDDIETLSQTYRLMFDLVVNHVSSKSPWFKDYQTGMAPARHYFIEMDPDTDLSEVTRPRSSPLLTPTQTPDGEKHVWTTFSEDQIDLNVQNPDLFFEMLDILFYYISKGARVIRLDAIAFLWKKIGTTCLHLPETHEVVKLLRDIFELVAPDAMIITETNVPHEENISYFGDGDEAHMVYQFSLPPLLMHALQTGDTTYLTTWANSLGDLPPKCTYFNFTSSHDGIGVRPLQGLIPDKEVKAILKRVEALGGVISMKQNSDGSESPYELNITYFNALGDGGEKEPSDLHIARFMCSQTVALAFQGIPAVYFNCLIGAQNNLAGIKKTGRARTINRGKWDYAELNDHLDNKNTVHAQVYHEYIRLLEIRKQHSAFHPDGLQKIWKINSEIFVLERTSPDGSETILSMSNFTSKTLEIEVRNHIPSLAKSRKWIDLISDKPWDSKNGTLTLKPYQTYWLT